jgi:phosphoribosylaminoimidazolecarboxamide formyltransferase/IMP cyclohydrolase
MPTALLSVSDKTNLVDHLARPLAELGWDLLASGGTAAALRAAGLEVTEIGEYTDSPEILGGRVKTLHPKIYAGLLTRGTSEDRADLERIQARKIDLVAVNLYPFKQVTAYPETNLAEAIESIDIGGVTLIRAAAKNHQQVTVLISHTDYSSVVEEIKTKGGPDEATRRLLAEKAFAHTAAYDTAIYAYLAGEKPKIVTLYPVETLRYGENPHQQAIVFGNQPGAGPLGGRQIQGKPISYNNLLDLDAAWRAAASFERPTVCIVKHLSPCGIASSDSLALAFPPALASDPVSAFGAVIATNRIFDDDTAGRLGELFVECIAAPGFTKDALKVLNARKNLRLIEMGAVNPDNTPELRSVVGGVLEQTPDMGDPEGTTWQVVTKRTPTPEEERALTFAWKACQHVKSNAIVFAKGEAAVGIGGGQPNRVDCVQIAAQRAGDQSAGAVMASDAFFPFPDSVTAAAQHGITAIIQPGGSIRDEDSIRAADENDIAMVFTGVRHFRH